MNTEDEDPTIICNIMKDFRASSNSYYRSSMLPLKVAHEKNTASSVSKARKLKFDDSSEESTGLEIHSKKMKFATPMDKEKLSDVMSPWEINRLKSEALRSRAQILEAEERISKLEGLKLETELHYAKEKKVLEDALKQERMKATELENRLKFIRKREAETVERYAELKSSENSKENSHQQMLLELQKENHNLKEQVYEFQNEIEKIKKSEKDEVNVLRSELESLKTKDEFNTELIESIRNELTEKNSELRKLEMEQTKLLNATKRVKDLESERDTYLETRAYVESQNRKLERYNELEKELAEIKDENRRLKSSISNTMYLEEKYEDLQIRQKAMNNLEQDVVNLRSENNGLRVELDSWYDLAKHYCVDNLENLQPFTLVQRRLIELVRKEVWMASDNKNLEIKANQLKEKLAEKETELTKCKEQLERLKESSEIHVSNIRRLKKQLNIVSWERNDLRNLLDSCQKDMTINSEAYNNVDAFRKVIDGYKERMTQIENDPSLAIAGGCSRAAASVSEKEELLKRETALREENKKLSEKVQYLSDQLEYRNLKGDFDPRQTKIIHLKSNPTSESVENHKDQLTRANEEICKLRERIKVMEEGNNEDVTRIVEERVQTNSIKELAELKERAKTLEIQNQRLVEAFKKRCHDFREAVYMLLGYKLDALPNNQYRLCSQYAFDPQDVLLFQISQNDQDTMELLETAFSQTLIESIDLHLKQHKSIPLFLASLTIDLFNKQTITSFSTMETTNC